MFMHKKKILIVHSTLHIGGAEEVTANLCNRIDKSRFDVTVCYLKEKGVVADKIEIQGTPVIGIPSRVSGKTDYFTSIKLRNLIKKLNIQLVHSHDVHAFTDCSICKLTMPRLKFVHTFHFGNYPNREISHLNSLKDYSGEYQVSLLQCLTSNVKELWGFMVFLKIV